MLAAQLRDGRATFSLLQLGSIALDTWKTEAMAPTGGLEPPTFRLGGGYSILLNYVGEG